MESAAILLHLTLVTLKGQSQVVVKVSLRYSVYFIILTPLREPPQVCSYLLKGYMPDRHLNLTGSCLAK